MFLWGGTENTTLHRPVPGKEGTRAAWPALCVKSQHIFEFLSVKLLRTVELVKFMIYFVLRKGVSTYNTQTKQSSTKQEAI